MIIRGAAISLAVVALLAGSFFAIGQTAPATKASEAAGSQDQDWCTSSIDTYILDLREQQTILRWRAAECPPEAKEPRAVEPLVRAIYAEQFPRLSMLEANALKDIGDPRAVTLLMRGLKGKRTRLTAIYALGQLEARDAVEPLIAILLRSPDDYERERAADALAARGASLDSLSKNC